MQDLIQIIYVSSAVKPFTEAQLTELLLEAREANRTHDITGLLLYKDGDFMQVFEGPREEAEQLYENIEKDSRHTQVMLLIKEPIDERNFPFWTMDYRSLSRDKSRDFADFFHSSSVEPVISPGKAKDLLLSFKRT